MVMCILVWQFDVLQPAHFYKAPISPRIHWEIRVLVQLRDLTNTIRKIRQKSAYIVI